MRPPARRRVLLPLVLVLALATGACSPPTGERDEAEPPAAVTADGPHASPDRQVAEPEVIASPDLTRVRFDLGNIDVSPEGRSGEFVAPSRGTLTVPHDTGTALPVVVLGHLRAATCEDGSFRYPCPGGASVRYDVGMDYLADAIASQGYAVLAPDLAPVMLGHQVRGAYDQQSAWTETVRAQLAALDGGAQQGPSAELLHGGVDELRTALQVLDTSSVDWVVHSRSGMLVPSAAESLAPDHETRSIVYLATAHDLGTDTEAEPLDAPPPDVPSLGITGSEDSDVPEASTRWAAAHFDQDRREPLAVGTVRGFGHNAFNEATASDDDRRACYGEPASASCPGTDEAQALAKQTVVEWLRAVETGSYPTFMVDAATEAPDTWAGFAAQWFVHTPGPRQVLVSADATRDLTDPEVPGAVASEGASVARCRVVDGMSAGREPFSCPDTGDVAVRAGTAQVLVGWSPGAAVRFTVPDPGFTPRTLVLHVSPFTTPEGVDGVPVALGYAGTTVDLPPTTAGLRAHGDEAFGSMPTTVRVPLDPARPGVDLTELVLGGLDDHPGPTSGLLVTGIEVAP
ncbi:hypothetical protein Sked_02390 [Sanguibacter keddieii DSM 10542]|uniref:Alpha/beta hydrolase family protein n=1 Tax=Sanguibacter keddieii (strain ATCC 51767 / DSM 10542 / NCFB 3025 / ST-74) TaxID=446469 RepID=D1BJF2_SANKS|nr:hypothetical protein [Sanguibacter keddieii]ACZ20208.1 hypothetical protein Sked_02390 [Sanguibacter keddieii DSM 10542]